MTEQERQHMLQNMQTLLDTVERQQNTINTLMEAIRAVDTRTDLLKELADTHGAELNAIGIAIARLEGAPERLN